MLLPPAVAGWWAMLMDLLRRGVGRSVSREFRDFVSASLSQLPPLVAAGGFGGVGGNVIQSSVARLDWPTMKWVAGEP